MGIKRVREYVNDVFGSSMHGATVLSLGDGVVGVTHAAQLAIHTIGHAYAQLAGIKGKSGIGQISRMLGNDKIDLKQALRLWGQYVVGKRQELLLAMDWTCFASDKMSTLAVYVVTSHGRATPLAWRTYDNAALARILDSSSAK